MMMIKMLIKMMMVMKADVGLSQLNKAASDSHWKTKVMTSRENKRTLLLWSGQQNTLEQCVV